MNYKHVAIIIFIIFIIFISVISGIYYPNQLPVGHDTPPATVVFNQDEDKITINVSYVDKKRANNISIHYNNTVIADNLKTGDTVTLSEFSCNNTVYAYDKKRDGLKEISGYTIDCIG